MRWKVTSKTALLILLVTICAGCVQIPNQEQADKTELSSRLLIVTEEPATLDANSTVIRFNEMRPKQQRAFERAINESSKNIRIPIGVNYEVWREFDYVRYKNKTYGVMVAVP